MIRQLSFLDIAEPDQERTSGDSIDTRLHNLRVSAEMEVGRAGEYLVMADLLLNGWVAYPTSQPSPPTACGRGPLLSRKRERGIHRAIS